MEGYAECLESKIVDWDEGGNIEQMWEQVKKQWLKVQARCMAQ